jgi:hypothetical protein
MRFLSAYGHCRNVMVRQLAIATVRTPLHSQKGQRAARARRAERERDINVDPSTFVFCPVREVRQKARSLR